VLVSWYIDNNLERNNTKKADKLTITITYLSTASKVSAK
jgi:hypothetical protein